jgi:hypothetical protein
MVNELNVFYRICPYPALKSPIFTGDKLGLTLYCLRSFQKAFQNVFYKITFILDSCPPIYKQKIKKLFPAKSTFFEGSQMGDRGSLLKQVELASRLGDQEKVYLAEDDYVYLPEAGRQLVNALDLFSSVTLYDHPDYYHAPHLLLPQTVRLQSDWHWVSRVSTCHTFGAKAQFFKNNRARFVTHAPHDYLMWQEITQKYDLYCAVPSLATHLVGWFLAPSVKWDFKGAP